MNTIAVAGTFDTKGEEYQYVISQIRKTGISVLTIHTGVFAPLFTPDISNREIVEMVGGDIEEIVQKKDRGMATEILAEGMKLLLPKLWSEGRFDGIISFGGSGGTSLVTPAMRMLPIGVPKVMVSTMASGNVSQYVGTSDIVMIPSIVDVAGLNNISKQIFSNAVHAIAGMVTHMEKIEDSNIPLIAATMFGVTTPCVTYAKNYLELQGYEVLVFHATGTGGKTMEKLVEGGYIKGVLDLTTTEWCDELFDGVLNAGEHRLEAAGKMGIPQVVSVGALDMVNFGPYDSIPEKYRDRKFYRHNSSVTLMRTTIEENKQLGRVISDKLNLAKKNTVLMLPLQGVSELDAVGGVFYGPEEDEALFNSIKKHLMTEIEVIEMNENINCKEFAETAARKLVEMIERENA